MPRRSEEEKELQRSFEKGEWRPVADKAAETERFRTYAAAALRKDRRINIRISSRDLERIQDRALEEGIPYQTLIASVLHKYADNRLREN